MNQFIVTYSYIIQSQIASLILVQQEAQASRAHRGITAKLTGVQNKCLRVISRAYKATPVAALETENYTPSLDLYLDAKLAKFHQ